LKEKEREELNGEKGKAFSTLNFLVNAAVVILFSLTVLIDFEFDCVVFPLCLLHISVCYLLSVSV
jgi:hypothetical protein